MKMKKNISKYNSVRDYMNIEDLLVELDLESTFAKVQEDSSGNNYISGTLKKLLIRRARELKANNKSDPYTQPSNMFEWVDQSTACKDKGNKLDTENAKKMAGDRVADDNQYYDELSYLENILSDVCKYKKESGIRQAFIRRAIREIDHISTKPNLRIADPNLDCVVSSVTARNRTILKEQNVQKARAAQRDRSESRRTSSHIRKRIRDTEERHIRNMHAYWRQGTTAS